jgi:hypothetical protein
VQQDDRVRALTCRMADVQLLDLLLRQTRPAVGPDQQPVLTGRRSRPAGIVLQRVDLADPRVEEEHQADEQSNDEQDRDRDPA